MFWTFREDYDIYDKHDFRSLLAAINIILCYEVTRFTGAGIDRAGFISYNND